MMIPINRLKHMTYSEISHYLDLGLVENTSPQVVAPYRRKIEELEQNLWDAEHELALERRDD